MTEREEKVLGWTRPALRSLKPYYNAPTLGDPLRLDQNTNLMGPNPAIAAVDSSKLSLAQYPSRDSDELLHALADFHGHPPENFLAANGGDETLDVLVKAFTEPGQTMAVTTPSYSLYPFYARIEGLKLHEAPLRKGFASLDVDALLAGKPRLTIVANPNNPTGNRFAAAELERLLAESPGVVVVDEAYIEYAGLTHSLLPRIESFDNLVVLRTFSKAYGLAGLRIGYLAANRDLTARLRLAKAPFNLNVYSEAVAIAALEGQQWVDDGVRTVRSERERMASKLKALGFRVHPSDANFLLTDPPIDAGELLLLLRAHGILARTFPSTPALRECIRFTVGKREHTDQLVAALETILKGAA